MKKEIKKKKRALGRNGVEYLLFAYAVIVIAGFRCLNGDEERVIKVLDPWPPRWAMVFRGCHYCVVDVRHVG